MKNPTQQNTQNTKLYQKGTKNNPENKKIVYGIRIEKHLVEEFQLVCSSQPIPVTPSKLIAYLMKQYISLKGVSK